MNEAHFFQQRTAAPLGFRRRLLFGGVAALLAGCATNKLKKPPHLWPLVELEDAPMMPSQAVLERINLRTKVVIMRPTESVAARGVGLADIAAATLQAVCGDGGVEVVDRSLADRLDKELKLIEMTGKPNAAAYDGPQVADYAITVALGAVTTDSKFGAAGTDLLTKKPYPAHYNHSAKAAMTVRIYELPGLRLVASIPTEGDSANFRQNAPATQAQLAELMRKATNDGILDKKADVLNIFAPKGYISERRSLDKENIFSALISKATGAKTADEVEIVSLRSRIDPLTKRETIDQSVVAVGRISDVIGNDTSWIIVDDAKAASQVKRGDVVKVKHSGPMKIPGTNIKIPPLPTR